MLSHVLVSLFSCQITTVVNDTKTFNHWLENFTYLKTSFIFKLSYERRSKSRVLGNKCFYSPPAFTAPSLVCVTLGKFWTILCLSFITCERKLWHQPYPFVVRNSCQDGAQGSIVDCFFCKLSPTLLFYPWKTPHPFPDWEVPSMKREIRK